MKEVDQFFLDRVSDGILTVNSDGTIYNNKTKRYVGAMSSRYMKISMMVPHSNPKEIMSMLVHRLVYLVYKGPIEDGFEIDHDDSDRSNNHIDNLIKMTHSKNMQKAYKDGLLTTFEEGNIEQSKRVWIGNQYGTTLR